MATSFTNRLGTAPEEGIKAPCVVSSATNITLSGEQAIDTVALVAGNRCLVRGQTDATENGIYDVSTSAWTRSTDFNDATDVINGVLVLDSNSGIIYQVLYTGTIVFGTTEITFVEQPYTSHIVDTTDAHDASAISNVAAGNISATDIQAAINELDTEKAQLTDLASTANAKGASLIGLEDLAAIYDATTVEGALAEIKTGGYTNKADAITHQPVNGVIRFIGGTDGGWFKEITGAAPGTYSDNGGSYCGTQFIPTGGDGSAAWVRVDGGYNLGLPYHFDWFGLAGDDSDETTELAAAFLAAAGSPLVAGEALTYRSTASIVNNSKFDLNQSTLKFVITGATKCLDFRSNTSAYNGTIENAGSTPSGAGDTHCPVLIGDYGVGTGYTNIHLHHLTIINNRSNGNGIMITGDSNQIKIHDIDYPADANIGRPILIHWGGATTPTAGTTHPYNIEIDNIKVTDLTGMPTGDGAILFVSAAYNVTANNLTGNNISGSCAYVYAGDYGSQYAPTEVVDLVGQGITIDNITVSDVGYRGLWVNGNPGVSGNSLKLPIEFNNPTCVGKTGSNAGVQLSYCDGVQINNPDISNYDSHGIAAGNEAHRARIIGGKIHSHKLDGIHATNGASTPENWTIQDVEIYGNGRDGGTYSGVDISTSTRMSVLNNRFGATGETQNYSVLGTSATSRPNLENNHTSFLKAGGTAYSIGGTTDYTINATGQGNTSGAGTLYAGVPFVRYNERGQRTLEKSAAPTTGTWAKGERVVNSNPSVGTPNGWVCTSGGTPGTWTAEANL